MAGSILALSAPEAYAVIIDPLSVEEARISSVGEPILLKDRPLSDYLDTSKRPARDVRPASDFTDNLADDAGEALFFAPGLWVNGLDINEPRLSIRGFGIGNRQERSNIKVLRDGAPLTDVHGVTNLREVDLLAVSRVEIERGGAGDYRVAGDNLGGAVDYISPTGREHNGRLNTRIDVGSSIEGTPGGRIHADIGRASGRWDYFVSLTGGYDTGFRDNNERNEGVFNANVGYSTGDFFSTRFFFEALRSDAELAGGLTQAQLDDNPSAAAAPITLGPLFPGGPIINLADGAQTDEFGRTLTTGRVSNQTDFRLLGTDFTANLHYARRDVESPQIDFVGVVEEQGSEWGAGLTLQRALRFLGFDFSYRAGAAYSTGDQDSDRFENLDGESGDQTLDTNQQSTNLTGFAEATFAPVKRLLVNFGAKFIRTTRELTVDDDDNADQRRFTGISAQGGLVYALRDDVQVFGNVYRTYEPPSFSELISNNPADFNNLEEQDAFTWEAGFRGRLRDRISWDITYFNTDVENEIINTDEPETTGVGGTLVNVDNTTHKGFEAGIDVIVFRGVGGGSLTWRSAYSLNDFSFVDGGPLDVDGNRIAGVPEHVYRGELRYDLKDRWFVAVNAQIGAGDFFVDHENLVAAPTYTSVGFSAGYRLSEQAELFVSGENITDTGFAGGLTPVTQFDVSTDRVFTPAARASVYGGLRYRF